MVTFEYVLTLKLAKTKVIFSVSTSGRAQTAQGAQSLCKREEL